MLYEHKGGAVVTRLTSAMTPTGTSATLEASNGWPDSNFWIVIDDGTSNEEKILVGSRTGLGLSSLQRGADDTVGVSHSVGAEVKCVFTATEASDANSHINTAQGVHGVDAGDTVAGQADIATHAALTTGTHGATAPAMLAPVWPGVMWDFAGSAAPALWLLCDGSAVSRTTYADLFAAIGTTYGAGDGSTTFNVPNYTDRVARYGTPGETGGADADSITLSEANLPSHSHTSAAHTHTSAGHSHTGPSHSHSINHDHPSATTGTNTHNHGWWARTADGPNLSTSRAGDATGSSKFTSNGVDSGILNDSHSHSFNVPSYSGTSGTSGTGSTGSTTPGPTGSTTPGATGTTGNGQSFTVDTVPTYTGAHKIIFAGV